MSKTTAGTTTSDTPGRTGTAVRPAGRRLGVVLQGLAIAVGMVLMVGGFALIAVDYRPYRVPTDSMEPAIQPDDTVLARRTDGSGIGRGDVVVFKDPAWGDNSLMVKRVVAVGGDTLVCCDARHRLSVNGTTVDEPYLSNGYNDGKFSVKVPAGRLFLLGDNRLGSLDSRTHLDQVFGTVPASAVLGRVEGTAWPAAHLGVMDRTTAFDRVGGSRASRPGPLAPAAYASLAGAALILLTAAIGPVAGLVRRSRRAGREPRR